MPNEPKSVSAKEQAIRLRRALLAGAGGVMFTVAAMLMLVVGVLRLSTTQFVYAIVVFWLVSLGFVYAIRSGLNLRFSDPSLTLAQMVWATLCVMTLVYLLDDLRPVALMFYLLVMMFGCFRLSMRGFLSMAAIGAAGYGAAIWLLYRNHPQVIELGRELLTFCVFVTVTLCFCFLGADISRLRSALTRRNHELREAIGAAENANRAKTDFLASMSHEIRTPLNAVLGMGALLDTPDLDDDKRDRVATLRRSGEHLLTLVDGLLDSSRAETSELVLEHRPFDLHAELEQVRSIMESGARAKNLQSTWDMAPNMPRDVIGDAARIRQILVQLIANATKFTHDGSIALSGRMEEDDRGECRLRFAITDSGIGIAREQHEAIFTPFMQADASATRRFSGIGLGLALARRLSELMGGGIALNSAPGKGSTFEVTLVVRRAHQPAAVEQPQPVPNSANNAILVVDDSEDNRLLVKSYLAATPFRVEEAVDARTALSRFANERFALVLMDIHMPEIDGLTAARELRALERTRALARTPIIAITADTVAQSIERSHEAGCDAHLSKPLRKNLLIDTIERLLAPCHAKPSPDDPGAVERR